MTNREWLESLSDEELAKWISDNFAGCAPCENYGKKCDGNFDCLQGYKKWLQAEHDKED